MKKPLLIGITGGIGSGKTTISDLFSQKGYFVFNSDNEARKLQNEDPEIRQKLIKLFGDEIYNSIGLDRKKVSKIVFEKKELLSELNKIIHPAVKKQFQLWIQNHKNEKILFIESAILFESGFNFLVDKVLVITASRNIRIKRVMNRDGLTEEQVLNRITNQLSEKLIIEKADFVIHTDDNISTNEKMNKILDEILKF